MDNKKITSDAVKAIKYDAKKILGGGYKLKYKPNCYGIVMKWLIHENKMTYEKFGELYNNTSGPNINNIINRTTEDRFLEEDLDKITSIFKVSVDYFKEVSLEVKRIMEK